MNFDLLLKVKYLACIDYLIYKVRFHELHLILMFYM